MPPPKPSENPARPAAEPPFVIAHAPPGSQLESLQLQASREVGKTIFGVANAVAQAGIEALSPPRCAACGWFSRHLFCEQCALHVRSVEGTAALCDCCGEPFDPLAQIAPGTICEHCRGPKGEVATPIERARSLWMLRGPVRLAVHSFKYQKHTALASSLGSHMGCLARREPVLREAGLVVPVPLHGWREWARGFNQSGLLAQSVAREMGLPCSEMLRRVRHTPTQTTLSRSARDANVRAAFQVRASEASKYLHLQKPEATPILLVDDVWTTGATLRECARALRKAGFGRVCALTLARRGH